MSHTAPHHLAGCTVNVALTAPLPHHAGERSVRLRVEDWNDRALGRSWMFLDGNLAVKSYGIRREHGQLPMDNQVVYGTDFAGRAHLVHDSELLAPARTRQGRPW
ncbi:MAG: hypothetical protein ACRDQB_12530 [Thermocrispum sp.]